MPAGQVHQLARPDGLHQLRAGACRPDAPFGLPWFHVLRLLLLQGTMRASPGGEFCDGCPAGTFAAKPGSPTCAKCSSTQYSSYNASTCYNCPTHSTMHVSGSFCVCDPRTCLARGRLASPVLARADR